MRILKKNLSIKLFYEIYVLFYYTIQRPLLKVIIELISECIYHHYSLRHIKPFIITYVSLMPLMGNNVLTNLHDGERRETYSTYSLLSTVKTVN